MTAGKGIVFTLRRGGEGLDAAQLPVCAELFPPSCQDLVAIGLMAYVPHDSVFRRVEHIMQGYSNLHDTEARGQMAGIDRHFLHDVFSQLFAKHGQIVNRQLAQILWVLDLIE